MNFKKSVIKNIYSSRGAKRGMFLAGLGVGFWLIWAVGYIQGKHDQVPIYFISSPANFSVEK